jgi:hypothetical protein
MLEIFHCKVKKVFINNERSDPIFYFQKKFEGNRLKIRKDMGLQSFISGH